MVSGRYGVLTTIGARDFLFPHTRSEGPRGPPSLPPGDKTAVAWHWPPTAIKHQGYEWVQSYTSKSPLWLHGLSRGDLHLWNAHKMQFHVKFKLKQEECCLTSLDSIAICSHSMLKNSNKGILHRGSLYAGLRQSFGALKSTKCDTKKPPIK